jgi:phosphoribosylanthranilate isomerase
LTRVKICGLCRTVDAAAAVAAGADYVGVILAPGSARRQSDERAMQILDSAVGARRVGVFVDAGEAVLVETAERLELEVLQLHGEESTTLVERLRARGEWTVWKAIRPRSPAEFLTGVELWGPRVDGLLVDGWSHDAAGGTGTRFDWAAVAPLRDRIPSAVTFIAAGGLAADNVAGVVRLLRPDIVDVSSGVEASPCQKSADRMRAFVQAARTDAIAGSRT